MVMWQEDQLDGQVGEYAGEVHNQPGGDSGEQDHRATGGEGQV